MSNIINKTNLAANKQTIYKLFTIYRFVVWVMQHKNKKLEQTSLKTFKALDVQKTIQYLSTKHREQMQGY